MAPIIGRVHIGYLPQDRCCWNFETRTTRRCLREASSSSRKNDGGNSELSEQRLEAAWSRRGGRGWARMHDDKMRAQAGRHYVTSCLLGAFRTHPETRQEFLSAINLKGGS